MEASIQEPNIKFFVRLLQCAARFGDDLCMHANKDVWELAVTNSSKSAHCQFRLQRGFFTRYKATGDAAQQRKGVNCKLLVKSVLNVLGKTSSLSTVDRVDLRIVDPSEELRRTQRNRHNDEDYPANDDVRVNRGASIELKLLYKHGITKKHFLHLAASEFFRAEVDPASTPSGFTIEARVLRDWLDHFSIAFTSASGSAFPGSGAAVRNENQLGWMFAKDEVRVKSWEGVNSALSTEVKLNQKEFDNYEVVSDSGRVDLTLPIKEFKAMLQLAEQLSMSLDINFSEATQPMTIASRFVDFERDEAEMFDIFGAIATTHCDAFRATESPRDGGANAIRPTPPVVANGSAHSSIANGHGGGGGGGSGSSSRSKRPSNSAQQQGRSQRSRLSMSVDGDARARSESVSGAKDSVTALASQRSVEARRQEPLFMPRSQRDPEDELRASQVALDESGLGDMDAAGIFAAMDDLDDPAAADDGHDENAPVVDAGPGFAPPSPPAMRHDASFVPPPPRQLSRPTPSAAHPSQPLRDITRAIQRVAEHEQEEEGETVLFDPEPGMLDASAAGDTTRLDETHMDDDEGDEMPATQHPTGHEFESFFAD